MRKRANKKPRHGAPIHVDKDTWLYVVERQGMTVVHKSNIFYIPWRLVKKAVAEKSAALRSMEEG